MHFRGVFLCGFLLVCALSLTSGAWWTDDAFSSVRFSPQDAKAISFDFGVASTSKVGGAAVGGAGDVWNPAGVLGNGDATQGSLVFVDGSASPVRVRLVRFDGFWGFSPGNGDAMYGTYVYPADLGAQDSTVELLDVPAGSYELYVYGHAGFPGYGSSVSISAGGRASADTSVALAGEPWQALTWTENSNYVKVPVAVNAGETIRLVFHPTSGNPPILGGLQLVPVAGTLVAPAPVTSVTTYSCTDSDSGLTYGTQGTVTAGQTTTFSDGRVATSAPLVSTDSCSGMALTEYTCTGDLRMQGNSYTCPYGCSAGACLSAPVGPALNLLFDVDGDGLVKNNTDGLLILRKLFTFTGESLFQGIALPSGVTQAQVETKLSALQEKCVFDVDGNGQQTALTDGILLMRYMDQPSFLTTFTEGVITTNATRRTREVIIAYLNALEPGISYCQRTSTTVYTCQDSDGNTNHITIGGTSTSQDPTSILIPGDVLSGFTTTYSDGSVVSTSPLISQDSCAGNVLTEYHCTSALRVANSTITCVNGCVNRACVSSPSPTVCATDVLTCADGVTTVARDPARACQFSLERCPAPPPATCAGCSLEGKCLPFGLRFTNVSGAKVYCGVSTLVLSQKVPSALAPASCDNNYECASNVCSEGTCVEVQRILQETSVFRRAVIQLLCRLTNFFDSAGYDSCVATYLTSGASPGAGS